VPGAVTHRRDPVSYVVERVFSTATKYLDRTGKKLAVYSCEMRNNRVSRLGK